MAETIRILNRSHTALTLTEPAPNPEKLGDAPPLRSVSLAGNGAVSEVDADTYRAWAKANEHHTYLTDGILEEVGDDYAEPEEVFGFEPALEAATKDRDEKRATKEGSTVAETEAGALTGEQMTPENGTPPGDDPGEPRHASQPGEPEPTKRRGKIV